MRHFKRNCRRLTGLVFYCLIAAVTYGQTHTIRSSSFGPRQDFITDQNPNGIVIADLDGDGKPDLVSTVVDQVTIHFDLWQGSVAVQISDLNGRVLITRAAVQNGDRIDLSSLAAGVYFVKIVDSKKGVLKVEKIFKE